MIFLTFKNSSVNINLFDWSFFFSLVFKNTLWFLYIFYLDCDVIDNLVDSCYHRKLFSTKMPKCGAIFALQNQVTLLDADVNIQKYIF